MSKETIKLYSHDGTKVNVVEVTQKHYDKNETFLLQHNWLTYEEAHKDMELERKVKRVIKKVLAGKLENTNCDDKLKEDIKNLKNDLDVMKRLERLEDKRFESIDTEQVHLSERIDQLSRKLNGKDNRVDALSDKIDNIKKENKRGQDMLLDRIKEVDSDLKEQIKRADRNVRVGNIQINRMEKLRRKTKDNSKQIRNARIHSFINLVLTSYLAYLILVN